MKQLAPIITCLEIMRRILCLWSIGVQHASDRDTSTSRKCMCFIGGNNRTGRQEKVQNIKPIKQVTRQSICISDIDIPKRSTYESLKGKESDYAPKRMKGQGWSLNIRAFLSINTSKNSRAATHPKKHFTSFFLPKVQIDPSQKQLQDSLKSNVCWAMG